jgi:predicted nucleic acid-binding protein
MSGALRVVDTSVWIELLIGGAAAKKLASEFPPSALCVVPTIVQLELAKWVVREVGEDEADQLLAYTDTCVVTPLDTTLALRAAELHREHGLATADAIVYATALHHGAELLTCDAHFKALHGVAYFPKRA